MLYGKVRDMEYWTVGETAKRWNVPESAVDAELNEGRIPGAVLKECGWLIPAGAKKPENQMHGQDSRVVKMFMPIFSIAQGEKHFEEAVLELHDEEECTAAWAGRFYFQGEVEKVRATAERCFGSESADIRLSVRWLDAMASIAAGDIERFRGDFAEIVREGKSAEDETVRVESEYIQRVSSIYFHEKGVDIAEILPRLHCLPEPARYFAMYASSHALYLLKEYQRAIGEVQAALALMPASFPVVSIYLNIVGAMASNSLAHKAEAQKFFDRAWEIALPEGYLEPFAEHHGLLQGLVERKVRTREPEVYRRISDMVYRFSRGWMKIHNPKSAMKVTDSLTPYEFSIAMLASKGRTNKEIADYMSISVNAVKGHLSNIFQKIGISNRSELKYYVNH